MLRTIRAPERAASLGDVRRLTGMTNRAIRFYEDKGLISARRDSRGQRRYETHDLDRLIYIGHARQAGLKISDIRQLLDIGDQAGEAQRMARTQEFCLARLMELEAELAALERSARALGVNLSPRRPQLVAM